MVPAATRRLQNSTAARCASCGALQPERFCERCGEKRITTHDYSAAHDSRENKAFVKAYREVSGGKRPNFMAVGGFDGMAAIVTVVEKLGGVVEGAHRG